MRTPGSPERRRRGRIRGFTTALAGSALLVGVATVAAAPPAQAAVSGFVRVDQVGFLPGESKQAYLMAPQPVTGARYAIVDARGRRVLSGTVTTTSSGSWNDAYPAVYPISFDRLRHPGR